MIRDRWRGRHGILYDGIFQQRSTNSVMVDGRVGRSFGTVCSAVLKFPGVLPLVVEQSWVVVTLVEVFQDRREDLWLFFRQVDAFGIRLEELASARRFEEGRLAENVFVSGEETLLGTDADGDDG